MDSEVMALMHETMNLKLKQDQFEEDDDVVERCYLNNRYVRNNEVVEKRPFKTVYKGFDEVGGVEVAWNQVKIILDDDNQDSMQSSKNLEKVYSEVRLLNTLRHHNVVKSHVTWMDEEKKTLNMITESFTSGSLREFRMKHKLIDLKAVKNWARQILGGLVYLHSQEPPIIHGDLSCDNIFVNGCRGEVKIGDIGLASFTRSRALDFMAPEFFEEKYDELVDIYSFGMCILEVVTCEHPYSECKGDQSEIREKVTSGVKPLCLSKVRDLQVKEFIEKCLVPAAQRLSAKELLKDPCLAEGCINKEVLVPRLEDFFGDMQLSDDNMVSLGSSCVKKDDGGPSCVLSEELPCVDEKKDLDVKKEKNEEKFVTIKLRVVDVDGNGHNIEFPFNLDAEDPHETAKDMIEEVGIIHEDVDTLADRIKDEILKLVPTWRPSFGKSSYTGDSTKSSSGVSFSSCSSITSSCSSWSEHSLEERIQELETELERYREAANTR
uniref:probable serine/threonine-protein kinase WNK4 n=1 Tax=Erigeron canadensis TaxID=72917 RepID=UPI001CB8C803|nr:probable serine/threonine-protein kinase WNK4 [Erigeron canadensis]